MTFLAPILGAWPTILAIVGALLIWTALSLGSLYRQTRAFIATVKHARALVIASENASAFAAGYQETTRELGALSSFGPLWNAYRETLIVPAADSRSRIVRSTVRPDGVFDLSLLGAFKIKLRYQSAMPGMLVGAGLLFTFVGLAAALGLAGDVVTSADPQQSRLGLHNLLDAASFKFITSLVGLLFSIIYTLCRNGLLRQAEQSLDDFNADLEQRVPLATPAFLQHEANETLRQQFAALDTFSNTLAINIGQALDSAFDQRLGEHIGPLREAIEELAGRTHSQNEDAVRQMLEAFTERLTGGTRDHLDGVTEKLADLGIRLDGLQTGLVEASTRMSRSAEDMATRMGEGAEAALARMTDQMSGLIETLRNAAAQTRDAGADAAQSLGSRIDAAAAGLEAAASQMTAGFAEAAANTGEVLAQAATGSRVALTQGANDAAQGLQDAAAAVRQTLDIAGEGLARQATALAAAAEAVAARIAGLDRAAREAVAPFAAGAADLRQAAAAAQSAAAPLRGVADSLGGAVHRLGDAAQGLAATQIGANKLAQDMATAAQRFEGVDRSLGETLKGLAAGLDEFTRQVQRFVGETDMNLAKAAGQIATLVAELNTTLEDGLRPPPLPPTPNGGRPVQGR